MLQPQPPRMHHTLPRLCYALKGCVCVLSKVFHVTATSSQNAPYTTQIVLCFEMLCVRFKQGVPCYSHSLPECNAYFQILVSYSVHPQQHAHIVPANCYHFGALLRVMCIILLNCSSRAAAVFVAHITQLRAMLRAECSCCECLRVS